MRIVVVCSKGPFVMDVVLAMVIGAVVLGGVGLQAVVSIVEALAKRQPVA